MAAGCAVHSSVTSQSFFTEVITLRSQLHLTETIPSGTSPYTPQQGITRVDFQKFKQIVRSIRKFDTEIPMQSECGRAKYIQSAHGAPSPHPQFQIRHRCPDVPCCPGCNHPGGGIGTAHRLARIAARASFSAGWRRTDWKHVWSHSVIPLPPILSKHGGDALWALMLFVGFRIPSAPCVRVSCRPAALELLMGCRVLAALPCTVARRDASHAARSLGDGQHLQLAGPACLRTGCRSRCLGGVATMTGGVTTHQHADGPPHYRHGT